MLRFAIALIASGSLGVPAVASASSVALADRSPVDYGKGWVSILYEAAPGEVNRVVLTTVDANTIRVADAGAVIATGPSCRSVDAHTAECTVAGMAGINGLIAAQVHSLDGDDVVESQGPGLSAYGGPGNDRLESSSIVAGVLDGGGGRDTLLGGSNQDTLTDGDVSGAADADVLDGRAGGARVSYEARSAPVRVDLAGAAPAGEAGEGDVLRNITGVVGGRGDDILRGDDQPNFLDGGPGDDRVSGLGRDDLIEGGHGDDRVSGQAGDDFIDGGAGRDVASGGAGRDLVAGGPGLDTLLGGSGPDSLSSGEARCGSGDDQVWPDERPDLVARDCEQVRFELRVRRNEFADNKEVAAVPHPVRTGARALTFRVQCPFVELDGEPDAVPMRGRVSLRSGKRLLGSASLAGACGDTAAQWVRILVPLRRTARRGAVVTVAFTGRNVPNVPWQIRL